MNNYENHGKLWTNEHYADLFRYFTVQHLLNGRDIATMSDDEIFRVIAQTEAEIDRLDQIKSKPARLVKLIAQKRGDLEKLIAFLNAQDDAQQAA